MSQAEAPATTVASGPRPPGRTLADPGRALTCSAPSGAHRSCSCACRRRISVRSAGRSAAGAGRIDPVADAVEGRAQFTRKHWLPSSPICRDQLGDPVRAVRLGCAAGTGWHRCDHERDRRDVHGARRVRVLRRADQQAARDRSGRGIRRRRRARERQDGRCQRLECGARRNVRRIAVWHRRQHGASIPRGHSLGRSRCVDARVRRVLLAPFAIVILAERADSAALLGLRCAARRAVHRRRVLHVLSPHLSIGASRRHRR